MDIVNLKKFLFWILVSCPSPVPEIQDYLPEKLQTGTHELSFQNKHLHGRKGNPKTQYCCCAFVFRWGLQRVAVETKGEFLGNRKDFEQRLKCSEPYSAGRHHSARQNLKWMFLWYLYPWKNNKTEQKHQNRTQWPRTPLFWCIFCRVWTLLVTELSLIIVWRLIKLYTKITVGIWWCLV